MNIKGKTIVITGGASGLGKAVAKMFAQEGANVVLIDLNTEEGKKLSSFLG
jgi:3-oxoacyl-[acyl-carrier protein] reductase